MKSVLGKILKKNFYLKLIFLIFFNYFHMLMLKIDLIKKNYYFNIFINKNHFKTQFLHKQARSLEEKLTRQITTYP